MPMVKICTSDIEYSRQEATFHISCKSKLICIKYATGVFSVEISTYNYLKKSNLN